jgi:hypothetical protein
MTCWYVACQDLKILFKDTGALILLFILPIVVITIASYALSYQILLIRMCLGALRPPMVIRMCPNNLWGCLQPETLLRLYGLQFV